MEYKKLIFNIIKGYLAEYINEYMQDYDSSDDDEYSLYVCTDIIEKFINIDYVLLKVIERLSSNDIKNIAAEYDLLYSDPKGIIKYILQIILFEHKADINKYINHYCESSLYKVNSAGKMEPNIDNTIINKIYIELFAYIKKNIVNIFPKIKKQYISSYDYINNIRAFIYNNAFNWSKFLYDKTPQEQRVITDYIINKYFSNIKEYIIQYTEKHHISDSGITSIEQLYPEILPKLKEYVDINLKKIFLSFSLQKDKSNTYIHSWFNSNGDPDGSGREYYFIFKYLYDNYEILNKYLGINLRQKAYNDILQYFLTEYYPDLINKIIKLIGYKNDSLRFQRSKDLIQNDDEIGQKTPIDYDPTADHVRTRPIIIIKDKNTNRDYVFFGSKGASHGSYIETKLMSDAAMQNIDVDPYYMGYGYLLGKVAFVDETGDNYQFGYTLNDEVDILKTNPKIEKVYQTGGHPHKPGDKVTRLAILR